MRVPECYVPPPGPPSSLMDMFKQAHAGVGWEVANILTLMISIHVTLCGCVKMVSSYYIEGLAQGHSSYPCQFSLIQN